MSSSTEPVSTGNANTGWTGGQNAFGDFAPGMVHYTDKVLFDEVWERTDLSKRDRSLVTDRRTDRPRQDWTSCSSTSPSPAATASPTRS